MVHIKHQLMLLMRVIWDFIQGIYGFHWVEPSVTVFGSARLTAESAEYALAHQVGMALGENGHTVMTGGGPGLMEAASRGARESGGRSIACRIQLSIEQNRNNFIDRAVSFRYFFVRKVMLMRNSYALVVLPGGLGTLDELFEALTLIQTRKISPLPIVFIGREYWQPLLDVVDQMVVAGTITVKEMNHVSKLMLVTDDVNEMIVHLATHTSSLPHKKQPGSRQAGPFLVHQAEAGKAAVQLSQNEQ